MIVVVGNPVARAPELGGGVDGTAVRVAIAARRAGADVQLVGKTGDDQLGDEALLALGVAGVGHVAVLRDSDHPTPVAIPEDGADGTSMLDADTDGATLIMPDAPGDRPSLEPADVELALRYLPDHRVIVVAEPLPDAVVAVIGDAAGYAGAHLVVVVAPGSVPQRTDALAVEASTDDADGTFAAMLGELAALLDRGASPEEAFDALRSRVGPTRVGG